MANKQIALMACLLAFGLGSAYAEPTITGMKASPARAQTKAAVKVVIRGKGLEDAICALWINFGDGSATVREMDWSKKVRFPIAVKKSYARPGKYRVSFSHGNQFGHVSEVSGQRRNHGDGRSPATEIDI